MVGSHVPDHYGWNPEQVSLQHDQPRLVGRGDFTAMEKEAEEEIRAVMGEEASTGIHDLILGRSKFVII